MLDMLLLSSVVLLVQADGQDLLQSCTSEQWDLAEALIVSGSTLEAQNKVHLCAYRDTAWPASLIY